MPIVTMPDGTQVEMPDEVTPELGQRLRAFNTFKQLGGTRKADQPGYTFFPSGVTYRHADQKFWLPAASSWFSAGAQGLTSEGQAQMPETQEARDQAQLALEASKGLPVPSPQMTPPRVAPQQQPSLMTLPGIGATVPIPSGSLAEYGAALTNAPTQVLSSLKRGIHGGIAALSRATRTNEVTDESGNVYTLPESSMEKAKQFEQGQIEAGKAEGEKLKALEPTRTGAKVANFVAKMPLELAKFTAEGPFAPAGMAMEMAGSKYIDAKEAGATDEQALAASGIEGTVGGIVGLMPGGKQAKTATELVLKKIGRGFVLGGAFHTGGAGATWVYNPEEAKKQLKDPMAWGQSIASILAYEGAGLSREIGGVKRGAKEVASEPPAPRTADQIRAEAAEAARKGDFAKVRDLKAELDAIPQQAPLEGEIVSPEGATPVGPEGTVFKGTSPYGLVKAGAEPTPIVEGEVTRPAIGAKERPALGMAERIPERPGTAEGAGFNDRINQLQTNLDADSKRLSELQNQLGIEQDRFKRTKSQKAKSNIEQIENLVYDLEQSTRDQQDRITQMKSRRPTAIEPKEAMAEPERVALPVEESTSYKGERQGALMGPDDAQLVARDPQTGEDIGRLWVTKTGDGFEVRKVETDPNYQRMGVATKLYSEAAAKFGPYAGSTDQTPQGKAFVESLRQSRPEIFERPSGLTPEGSGTELLSNEELARSQRGDTYYRVDRSGRVTNIGPQPDATIRNGEAVVMVDGQTGKPQVQNSQGLGDDTAVLSKFGNRIMQVHEAGRGMIADNLGLQQMYEAGMGKAKEALGLERAATDGEVVRAIGQKIGRLGATVKETAVRIMNQIKGIGRDLANAIAEHLHQAVSGSRESQLGAIGEKPKYTPEEEAHYQSKTKEARDLIAEFLPGEENKALRAEAYSKLPSKAGVIAEYRRGAEPTPEPTPKYNRLEGFAKSAVQPLVDAPKVARALISGDNTATNRVWDLLQKREVLPQVYKEGSFETPKIVRPLIFGEDLPKIVKDFKENILGGGAKATFNRFMRSPHNLEEPVFGKYNTPTQDLQMSVVSAMHNRNNLSNYFRDLLRTTKVKDNSVEMQAEAKPVFERFQKIAAEMEPLQVQRSDLEKTFGDLKKAGKDTTEAKNALRDWDSAHAQRLSTLEAEMGAVQNEHQKMLRDFASKYGDARVALAAEYDADKVPSWIKLSAEEKKAADGMRDSMRSIKDSLDRVGIPTLDENYVTHLTKYLAPETAGTFERRTPREVLKFAPRAEDSSQWLPSVHAAVADYIPNVSRKLATQEFYNKWRGMIDPKDPNSLSNPASPNYAPNASLYLEGMFKTLDTPEALNFFDKAVNTLRDYENMKLLAANVRVGWKHAAGKLPSILAQHDVWIAPGALGQAKALVGKLSETNPIRTAVDKLGGKTVDWAKKAELVSYFANTREILGMLRENPFTSGVEEARKLGVGGAGTNKAMRTIFGDRAPDALAKFHRGVQKVTSNPVAAVEAWENGLDLLTSIEKGHAKGLEDPQNVKAFLNNILDFNFRGGADSPRLIKDPRTRYFIQFAQTPMKLAELKAKLIANAWKGGKDIYGTDHTANLVKHVLTIGVAFAVAKELGVNVKDSILHLPFLNSHQWGRIAKMAYYGTKGNLLDDPAARRKFNDTKAAFIGEKMPAVMGSPVFDIAKDVKTVLAAGPMGIVKQSPVYNQLKAILNGKPPKGFDSVPAYLTGERSHRSMEDMERRAIREGRKQIKYEQKLERNR